MCRLGHVHVACMSDDGGPTTRCAGFMLRVATCLITWGSSGVTVALRGTGPHRLVFFVLCACFWIGRVLRGIRGTQIIRKPAGQFLL